MKSETIITYIGVYSCRMRKPHLVVMHPFRVKQPHFVMQPHCVIQTYLVRQANIFISLILILTHFVIYLHLAIKPIKQLCVSIMF